MPEERNYHIFYRLLAGLSDKDKSSLHLTEAKDYHYLSQGNCYVCEGMDDKEAFANIRRAMKVKYYVGYVKKGPINYKTSQNNWLKIVPDYIV